MKANLANKIVTGARAKEQEDGKEQEEKSIAQQNIRIQDIRKWEEHGITRALKAFIYNNRQKNRDRLGSLKIEDLEFVNAIELVYRELEKEIEKQTTV